MILCLMQICRYSINFLFNFNSAVSSTNKNYSSNSLKTRIDYFGIRIFSLQQPRVATMSRNKLVVTREGCSFTTATTGCELARRVYRRRSVDLSRVTVLGRGFPVVPLRFFESRSARSPRAV